MEIIMVGQKQEDIKHKFFPTLTLIYYKCILMFLKDL